MRRVLTGLKVSLHINLLLFYYVVIKPHSHKFVKVTQHSEGIGLFLLLAFLLIGLFPLIKDVLHC